MRYLTRCLSLSVSTQRKSSFNSRYPLLTANARRGEKSRRSSACGKGLLPGSRVLHNALGTADHRSHRRWQRRRRHFRSQQAHPQMRPRNKHLGTLLSRKYTHLSLQVPPDVSALVISALPPPVTTNLLDSVPKSPSFGVIKPPKRS